MRKKQTAVDLFNFSPGDLYNNPEGGFLLIERVWYRNPICALGGQEAYNDGGQMSVWKNNERDRRGLRSFLKKSFSEIVYNMGVAAEIFILGVTVRRKDISYAELMKVFHNKPAQYIQRKARP